MKVVLLQVTLLLGACMHGDSRIALSEWRMGELALQQDMLISVDILTAAFPGYQVEEIAWQQDGPTTVVTGCRRVAISSRCSRRRTRGGIFST
ncbi:hypothetical protein GCM10007052_24360 [Halioglobus japonicus]|nr:hypothetical protein GCM10007052_24360 [Halioglobus japonicus]